MKSYILFLFLITPILALKLNDPIGNLIKSIYKETYNGFEVELEPFFKIIYESDSILADRTGVEILPGNNFNTLKLFYGDGVYDLFAKTDLNRLDIGWGKKEDVFQVNFNHTGKFENYPVGRYMEKLTGASGNSANLTIQTITKSVTPEISEISKIQEPLNSTEIQSQLSIQNFTNFENSLRLNLDIIKRKIGIRTFTKIFDPSQNLTQALNASSRIDLGLSNIRYSQKGIEIILRSDLNFTKSDVFPEQNYCYGKLFNKLPEHGSVMFLTMRLSHSCMGNRAILSDGCKSLTKLHGNINNQPFRPVAVTTHGLGFC